MCAVSSFGDYLGAAINLSGTLYFVGNDGANGYELWKSDGTTAGTVMVKDIAPGSASSAGKTSSERRQTI